jgi:hypothetical protein
MQHLQDENPDDFKIACGNRRRYTKDSWLTRATQSTLGVITVLESYNVVALLPERWSDFNCAKVRILHVTSIVCTSQEGKDSSRTNHPLRYQSYCARIVSADRFPSATFRRCISSWSGRGRIRHCSQTCVCAKRTSSFPFW